MPTTHTTDSLATTTLATAEAMCTREWGARAWAQLGPRFQRALLAEAVLSFTCQLDNGMVPDATARVVTTKAWRAVVEATPDAHTV